MAAGNFITEFLPTGKQNLAPAFAKKGSITACFLPRKYGGENVRQSSKAVRIGGCIMLSDPPADPREG